jgi:putative aldouronate transport system permease protein
MILPAFAFTFVFAYIPIGGLGAAFKDFNIFRGFWGSPWADQWGMANIIGLFNNRFLMASIWNTVYLSMLNLLIGFPLPIILALMINELRIGIFKKTIQTISYMPFFISWITVVGIVTMFLSRHGPLNDFLSLLFSNHERTLYLTHQQYFVPILVTTNLWKNIGWNSIIYIAAISSIDPQLYEAATVDGAGKWKQMLHITIPGLTMTMVVLFVLNIGGLMASNFELVYGLDNPFIDFDVIDTVIYRQGLLGRNYSTATALGFVRGLIALSLTLGANYVSKKINKISII